MSESLEFGSQAAAAANIFIDPATAVKRMTGKWPWLLPFLIICAVAVASGVLIGPISMRIMQTNPPEGMTPEQLERAVSMMGMFQKVGIVATPLIILIATAAIAGLMAGLSSMMDVKTSFQQMFTLLSYCSLITTLQAAASAVVILAKAGQLQSMQELQPPFGLDLVLTETSKPVWAILHYFSIFTIWYLVILTLAYAFLTGSSKTKAVMAITPAWVISLMFAVIGALFQK